MAYRTEIAAMFTATAVALLGGTAVASAELSAPAATKDAATGLTINKIAFEAGRLVISVKGRAGQSVSVVAPASTKRANSRGLVTFVLPQTPGRCFVQLKVGSKTSPAYPVTGCGPVGPAGTSLRPVGPWTADLDVKANDIVFDDNGSWLARRASKGKKPAVSPDDFVQLAAGVAGPAGPAGPDGKKGDEGKPGPVGMIFEGEWEEDVAYPARSVVTRDGSAFIAVADAPAGAKPEDGAPFALLSAKGEQGPAAIGNLVYRGKFEDVIASGQPLMAGDVVTFEGSAWHVTQNNFTGIPGPGRDDIKVLVARGLSGPMGPQGPQGQKGQKGDPGLAANVVKETFTPGTHVVGDLFPFQGGLWLVTGTPGANEVPGPNSPNYKQVVAPGETGPAGPAGVSPVLSTTSIQGLAQSTLTVAPGVAFQMIEPLATVQIGSGHRITAEASLSVKTAAGQTAPADIRVAVCVRPLGAAAATPLNGDLFVGQAFTAGAGWATATAFGSSANTAAGQHQVGFCVRNPGGANVGLALDGVTGIVRVTSN